MIVSKTGSSGGAGVARLPKTEEERALWSKLRDAVCRGDALAARQALSDGADANGLLYGDWQQPLLFEGIMSQSPEAVEALLEAGADPSALEALEGRSPHTTLRRRALRLACELNSDAGARMAGALTMFGADPAAGEESGPNSAAILYAARNRRDGALREMILAGFDPNSPVGPQKRSALSVIQGEWRDDMTQIMLAAFAERESAELAARLASGFIGPSRPRPRV